MVSHHDFADIAMPTHECWKHQAVKSDCSWEKKISKAVFRGTNTGVGLDETTNMRIKAVHLSNQYNFIDAEITKWNNRLKKNIDSEYVDTINMNRMRRLNIYKNKIWVLHNGKYHIGLLLGKSNGISQSNWYIIVKY